MADPYIKPDTINISSDERYKGDNKWFAAFKSFIGYGSVMIVVPIAAAAAWCKFRKIPFSSADLGSSLKSSWVLGWAGFAAAVDGVLSYFTAKNAEDNHYKLVAENHLLRDEVLQLGQTPIEIQSFVDHKNFAGHEKFPAASHAEQALADKHAAQEVARGV